MILDKKGIAGLSDTELGSILDTMDTLFDPYTGLLLNPEGYSQCVLEDNEENNTLRDELLSMADYLKSVLIERDKIRLEKWRAEC